MKLRTLWISLLVAVGSTSLHAATALKVLSAAPKGQQDTPGRQVITVHFNQPVAKLAENTALSSADCPLQITPNVAGNCRFSGTQTLQFEPTENWPQATRVTVTVPKGFRSALSGQKLASNYTFHFTTPVPRVVSVFPYADEHWISLNPTLYVLTSMPVDLSRVAQYARLHVSAEGKNTSVLLSARKPTEEELRKNFSYLSTAEKESVFALNPKETLQKGQKYTLKLSTGLPAQVGTAGMAKDYETSFYTFPALSVQKIISTGCLPFTPSIHFSSPVRKRDVWAALEVFPASAKDPLPENEREDLGYSFTDPKTQAAYFNMPLSFLKVKPHQEVKGVLKKGLRDIYGNVLEHDQPFTLTNDGYCPAVDFSAEGIGVLESYLPVRLPVELMNIPSLFVESARFNKNNFIPFYEVQPAYCAKKTLPGPTFEGEYTFPKIKDQTLRTYFNLSRFKPTAKDSILFSQFKVARNNSKEFCWLHATDNITDIGVTFKTSPQSILLWTTSLKTGQPLGGLSVELRGSNNRVVWTGKTDENGLAFAPGWGKLEVPARGWGQPALYAFITSPGGDAVVSNLWNEGMEPWRFNVDYDYNPTAQNEKAYLFTDRGIYRPGETVYLKGLVRERIQGAWQLPSAIRGTLTLSDARGEEIVKEDVTLHAAYGTFDTSFELPQTASTGYWDAHFTLQGVPQTAREPLSADTSFQVESVKPADFNVFVKPDLPQFLAGEEATFSASAQYYFGAPLSMAPARWTLRQENAWFTPKGYEDYTFTPYFLVRDQAQADGKLLLNASGQLDSRGSLLFAAKMPHVQVPTRVYAEVNIESPAHQNLFKRSSVLVHPADIYIGAKTLQEEYQQGRPVNVRLVAVTPDGKPAEATVTAEIYREQYYSVRKVGLSGRLEWVSERRTFPLPSQQVTVGKKGAVLTFVPEDAGSYYMKLTAKDLFGRKAQGGIDLYVSGPSDFYAARRDDDLLILTPNKNEYKVGQTARVRVTSPYEQAQALVTVEREGILDAWTMQLKGGENVLRIPIKENYLPNVYVGVVLVQGRSAKPATDKEDLGKPQGKSGYASLSVVPEEKRITTTLKTTSDHYEPRQTVTVELRTQVRGKGVPAEVAVMAVDEGILALTDYRTPDLFHYFYGSTPLSVFTMDNRSYVIGQRNFGEKGENRGGGGAAASKLGGTDLRTRFAFTPYYAAAVRTDAKGRAKVSFELPDNLTTFRIMAVSMTQSEFGQAEKKITVSKPLMLTPNLPRFAREGDTFTCAAILHNYEDTKGVFEVSAQAQGSISLAEDGPKTVSVPKGQSREIAWTCKANQAGEAKVTFAAQGRYRDALQSTLNVSVPEHAQTLAVSGATQHTQDQVLQEPSSLQIGADNRVQITLSPSALSQVQGAVSYLLTYPYTCLEQQLSKLTPAVGAADLVRDFKLADIDTLRTQAQTVLNNVAAYQHPTGGLGYWPGDLPDPYVTAYALEVLLQARQAGLDVPTRVVEKALTWLAGAFDKEASYPFPYTQRQLEQLRAYSTYVLARYGQNTQSMFNTLYAKREGLSPVALAYLLQAAHVQGRSATIQQTLVQQLLNKWVYTPTSAYVDGQATSPWLHENNVGVTAHVLQALLEAGHAPAQAHLAVAWLLTQQNVRGNWQNTATNAAVLRALEVYYTHVETQPAAFTATVTQADQPLVTTSFNTSADNVHTAQIPFPVFYQNGAEARLTFAKQGTGTLYYTVSQIYTPAAYLTPADAGFSITRQITTLDGQPVTRILTGERYKVTLLVKTAVARYFVVAQDFIPAGFSLVNTSLATESSTQRDLLAADNTAFTRTEQYEDRIYGVAQELPAGEHKFSYLVTATAAGTYTYPAAWAEEMYTPAVFGHNATSTLVIQ